MISQYPEKDFLQKVSYFSFISVAVIKHENPPKNIQTRKGLLSYNFRFWSVEKLRKDHKAKKEYLHGSLLSCSWLPFSYCAGPPAKGLL